MKMKTITFCSLLIAALLLPALLHAQVFTDDTSDAPVDGGLSLLIAGGIGYGVKK